MILEANARAYGAELARHLMNPRDNDHVTVHSVEGFIADDLFGAFAEAEAISSGTRCQKYLFSVSLNPPPDAAVNVEVFEATIAKIERDLGLVGQPRAVVFHEKNGRRHAHCVWSRIDAQRMTAIRMSHYKRKLTELSRTLYLEHGWDMPAGFREVSERDPLNYSREEHGQAKRNKRDTKTLKTVFHTCWTGSDSRAGFEAALTDAGFLLARGERRGFVAVDGHGKVWSLSRWCGVKPKQLRARLGEEQNLPSIDDALLKIGTLLRAQTTPPSPTIELRRAELVAAQRAARSALLERQETRRLIGLKERQTQRPKGMRAIFLRVTGQYDAFVQKSADAAKAELERDSAEQQILIEQHLAERRALQRDFETKQAPDAISGRDPRQNLVLATDDLELSTDKLIADPALILRHISKTEATFDRTDVLRALAKRINDPMVLRGAADTALKSQELVFVSSDRTARYTTRDYLAAEAQLQTHSQTMAQSGQFAVTPSNTNAALQRQDKAMQHAFGGRMSTEQRDAVRHVLDKQRLSCVVGLAGAGKSTMLAAAMDAWRSQGVTVHGAALAGKAADGLQDASGIKSCTLASLEMSWQNGHTPIAAGDVLVIDEAGMIGTRQLSRITARIDDIGAKMVLVGDPDQLQPIEAGTPFRDVVDHLGAARLTEIHRQRIDWQKQASKDLAAGDVEKAVQSYTDQRAVMRSKDRDDAVTALVEAYSIDVETSPENTTRLAFAHRRKDVYALNQAIRLKLREGLPDTEDVVVSTETGPRAFDVGDRIVFGRNDRDLGVKNGMLATIRSVDQNKISVEVDGDKERRITIDPRTYKHVDHGYAVTIHKSQGATVDQSYVLASRTMDRHLAYVAMTRHREALRLFVSHDDSPKWTAPEHRKTKKYDRQLLSGPSIG